MVSLESLVYIVVYLLIAALILGLLWWLIGYVERQGLGTPVIFKVVRVVFVVMVVLVLIGFLISFTTGHPMFRASGPPGISLLV